MFVLSRSRKLIFRKDPKESIDLGLLVRVSNYLMLHSRDLTAEVGDRKGSYLISSPSKVFQTPENMNGIIGMWVGGPQ